MTYQEMDKAVNDLVQRTTDEGFKAMCQDATGEGFYLYYLPQGMKLAVSTGVNMPDGFELADARRIMPTWPKSRIASFIRETSRRLPILTIE